MTQDIRDLISGSVDLLAFGEPTHLEPGFANIRNELFPRLAGLGFGSIAMETDRVAALAVDDYVRNGHGTFEAVMRDGFSHGFGFMETNRRLVAWMREYNAARPENERLAFHGFDPPLEMMSAPSPRSFLEPARELLGLDVDLAGLLGEDERWSRTAALMDAAASPGATPEAARLRVIADDMLVLLHGRAPELVAATSRARWIRTRTRLLAGLDLLRYHARAARPGHDTDRWRDMCETRDAIMARNLLDIREIEAGRGPTLVFAHNAHVQRGRSQMDLGPMHLEWNCAGSVLASLLGERYAVVVGGLGGSVALDLAEPEPGTIEGALHRRFTDWGLIPAAEVAAAGLRADPTAAQGYFRLDRTTLDGADAVLYLPRGTEDAVAYKAYIDEQRRGRPNA